MFKIDYRGSQELVGGFMERYTGLLRLAEGCDTELEVRWDHLGLFQIKVRSSYDKENSMDYLLNETEAELLARVLLQHLGATNFKGDYNIYKPVEDLEG